MPLLDSLDVELILLGDVERDLGEHAIIFFRLPFSVAHPSGEVGLHLEEYFVEILWECLPS